MPKEIIENPVYEYVSKSGSIVTVHKAKRKKRKDK